jgi:uncharacterized protein YhaN
MKILELQLLAFGPFTNLCLDLSAGSQGLQVLFGPNEAGKSSALRALRALLYGIPNNTPDNFLHDNPKLRLGGRLRHSDDTELCIIRRKGLKNTLLGPDGGPVPEAALIKFLAGVGQDLFATMFGIDHPALRRGGEEILQGGGEVGQSLFSAALGGVSLRQIQLGLDHEARQLFLPQGQNPKINKSLAGYRAAKRTIEEYSLTGSAWSQHTCALEEAIAERQAVLEALAELAKEQHRLERLQLALPKIAQRKDLWLKLQDCRDAVLLPPEFAEQRREAVQRLEHAKETEAASRLALERLSLERQGLVVPEVLLEHAEAITLLQQRLGSHRKAAQDRSRLLGQRRQLEAEVQALLAKLPATLALDQVKERRRQAAHRARVQELARQYQARMDRLDRATKDVQKYTEQLTKTGEALNALAPPRDLSELRGAVARARQQGDLEDAREQAHRALQAEERQAQAEIGRLGLWSGTLEELEGLPLPSKEAIDQFEAAYSKLNADAGHLNAEIQKGQADLAELDRQLDELRLAGAVPSEADLARARQHRDHLWARVRGAWLDGESAGQGADDAPGTGRALAEAYADSLARADEVADRLRREAERVTRQAALLAQREKAAKTLEQWAAHQDVLDAELRQQRQYWRELWQPVGITPSSPREMRAWLDRHGKLMQRAERVREHRHQLTRLDDRLREHRLALRQALTRLGVCDVAADDTFNTLLARGEALVEAIDEAARQRRELQRQLAISEHDLEGARRDRHEAAELLARWQRDWTAAVASLGLDGQALPVEAHAVLEALDELLQRQDEVDSLAQRIASIDRDAEVFAQEVKHFVAQVAPDLMETPVEQAVAQLHARLVRSQTDAARKAELDKQIATQEAALQTAQLTIERTSARLQALCRQAGCSHPDELSAAEARSAQIRQWQRELAVLEAQLLEQAAGATLDHLLQEAEAIDADALPLQLADLARRRQELEGRRSSLDQTIGRERTILGQMDGSARAAEAAEMAHALLAELRDGVERYVRLRLAALLLRRQIERYRVSHQGPLLSRASDLFAQLTLGSFAALEADYNEQDKPVLVGVRADGRRVDVRGMSDGTCDQLFLALRLASLEQYLAGNEPLPFIVDDILIQFDDRRAEAALQVLAELSTKTQVIFFTHHWRLVELAQKVAAYSDVTIQQLGG